MRLSSWKSLYLESGSGDVGLAGGCKLHLYKEMGLCLSLIISSLYLQYLQYDHF